MCEVPQLTDLDLTGIDTVAIDLETYDPNLKTKATWKKARKINRVLTEVQKKLGIVIMEVAQ